MGSLLCLVFWRSKKIRRDRQSEVRGVFETRVGGTFCGRLVVFGYMLCETAFETVEDQNNSLAGSRSSWRAGGVPDL